MENGSNHFFPCSRDGEERERDSPQGTLWKRGPRAEPCLGSWGLRQREVGSQPLRGGAGVGVCRRGSSMRKSHAAQAPPQPFTAAFEVNGVMSQPRLSYS